MAIGRPSNHGHDRGALPISSRRRLPLHRPPAVIAIDAVVAVLGVELELEVEGAIVFVDGVKVDTAGTVIAGTRSLRSSLDAMPTVRCPKGGGPDTRMPLRLLMVDAECTIHIAFGDGLEDTVPLPLPIASSDWWSHSEFAGNRVL